MGHPVNGDRRHDTTNAQLRESALRPLGLLGSGFSAVLRQYTLQLRHAQTEPLAVAEPLAL